MPELSTQITANHYFMYTDKAIKLIPNHFFSIIIFFSIILSPLGPSIWD